MFDTIGQQVIQTTEKQIDISELRQGVYLIDIRNNKHQLIRKEKSLKPYISIFTINFYGREIYLKIK